MRTSCLSLTHAVVALLFQPQDLKYAALNDTIVDNGSWATSSLIYADIGNNVPGLSGELPGMCLMPMTLGNSYSIAGLRQTACLGGRPLEPAGFLATGPPNDPPKC